VYFDDFNVTHTKSRIVQYNEYYPFGLQTANSWTREGAVDNKFLNNGGTELNPTTGWYDLAFRNYDPVLGRMHGVDPMASKYASLTPYNYSFNNPVSFTDPNGADPSGYYEGAEPIFEPYTMRMYHPAYGWLQDDHIYERIIGWRGPMPRWVGKLDWLFEKPGKRSAFGGWQGNMSMSLSSFFTAAWNNPLGGSWSGGESYLFKSYLQAVTVGWTYVEEHNGWRYVPGGKEGAMARLQQALAAPDLLGAQTGVGPGYPLALKNASLNDIMAAFRDIYASSRVGSYNMSHFFDTKGVSINQSSHRAEYVKVFNNGIKLVFTLNTQEKGTAKGYDGRMIDTLMPYYPAAKSYALGVGKGWGVDPTQVLTSITIGGRTIVEQYPYAMSIYGTYGNNSRMATLYFSDIYAFMSFSAYVQGK
jgi:RHS repeat-associated protein